MMLFHEFTAQASTNEQRLNTIDKATSNLSKAHVMCESSSLATWAIMYSVQ